MRFLGAFLGLGFRVWSCCLCFEGGGGAEIWRLGLMKLNTTSPIKRKRAGRLKMPSLKPSPFEG